MTTIDDTVLERHGLTREELMLCQHTAAIPANDRFPVMNLAQAVGVFCYELSSVVPLRPVLAVKASSRRSGRRFHPMRISSRPRMEFSERSARNRDGG